MLVVVLIVPFAVPQSAPDASPRAPHPQATANADQVANILGISQLVSRAHSLHAQTPCESSPTLPELALRQDILETVTAASLDADGVLAELESERARLSELSAALQSRRDRAVNLTNVAGLITGTGLGIAVNAMQFSSSTANLGNGLGVGSGIASTALSIIGIRQQHGPQHTVGRIPNMLAPLFARPAELNSDYPEAVLAYLRSVPRGEAADAGSRLDQLMTEWKEAGRVGQSGNTKNDQKIARLTSSLHEKTRLSIDDLSDRMAMLGDVTGRVGLMKRDLGDLMRSVRGAQECPATGMP